RGGVERQPGDATCFINEDDGMRTRLFPLLALLALVGFTTRFAAAEPDKAQEEAALQKAAEGFIEAFHKGDAKALAAFWTADGDYTDLTGRQMKGRAAIEKAFTEF